MTSIGRLPGDFPVSKFDRPVKFRRLENESLDWLEKYGVSARREFAPLAAKDYIWLFGAEDRLPVAKEGAGSFFNRLIHLLLIETQIILAKQYYHGLGLYDPLPSFSKTIAEAFPDESPGDLQLASLGETEFAQLHGRIFLEYCAVMIRAQWDKLTRLTCFVFGAKTSWGSISDGLKALVDLLNNDERKLPDWCQKHLQVFTHIAQERVSESGWLKGFRDPLLHDVGQHSTGVLPHKKSIDTTSEMWNKVCDEHDWLREATLALLASFISAKFATS